MSFGMEDLRNVEVLTPEDDISFETTELVEALTTLAVASSNEGEHFPYLWVRFNGMLLSANKVTLVAGDQSDGTTNYEVVIDVAL